MDHHSYIINGAVQHHRFPQNLVYYVINFKVQLPVPRVKQIISNNFIGYNLSFVVKKIFMHVSRMVSQ